nr:hypothetical protein GCM10010200_043280 [Actinomadura rugatobispora]
MELLLTSLHGQRRGPVPTETRSPHHLPGGLPRWWAQVDWNHRPRWWPALSVIVTACSLITCGGVRRCCRHGCRSDQDEQYPYLTIKRTAHQSRPFRAGRDKPAMEYVQDLGPGAGWECGWSTA